MTAKDAYLILSTKRPGVKTGKCYEYKNIFVFELTPDMLRLSKRTLPMLDGLISVNKKTKEIRDFKPFHISIEEYTTGVEIPRNAYYCRR